MYVNNVSKACEQCLVPYEHPNKFVKIGCDAQAQDMMARSARDAGQAARAAWARMVSCMHRTTSSSSGSSTSSGSSDTKALSRGAAQQHASTAPVAAASPSHARANSKPAGGKKGKGKQGGQQTQAGDAKPQEDGEEEGGRVQPSKRQAPAAVAESVEPLTHSGQGSAGWSQLLAGW